MAIGLVNADATMIPFGDKIFQCVVFSPPYWGLRTYEGTGKWVGGRPDCNHIRAQRKSCPTCGAFYQDAQLGAEPLHDCLGWATDNPCGECFICHVVLYMREIRRVLRDDGVVFFNIGDSYAGSNNGSNDYRPEGASKSKNGRKYRGQKPGSPLGLKAKDMALIPQRTALALQADGWYVRSDIIWAKSNPMPESVTDRPTKAHEYIWMLTKRPNYFWDKEAVKEPISESAKMRNSYPHGGKKTLRGVYAVNRRREPGEVGYASGRNIRTVWTIATRPYFGAHYATFPEALVERCLRAATSEYGACARCGTPWRRIIEKTAPERHETEARDRALYGDNAHRSKHADLSTIKTVGWKAGCNCGVNDTQPCWVLDPFVGSGTTLAVAKRMGLNAVGMDLSYLYLVNDALRRAHIEQPVLI